MRVAFMGTPSFAVPSLLALAQTEDVVGVFCRPDAVSGRGARTRSGPVKVAAEQLGLGVHQPATLRDEAVLSLLESLAPDLLVVAAYGLILPRAVLEAAPLGAVNVHASLLPRWRGAAPIHRAILAGDAQTGVSIMRMEEGLDTGPYCLQKSVPIGSLGATALTDRLATLGAEALVEALPGVADGTAQWTTQDEALVTYADKIAKSDVAITPDLSAVQALRHVRASFPGAPCRASVAGRTVTLISASLVTSPDVRPPAPGTASGARNGVLIGFADGSLLVERVRPQGKGDMSAADWARGVRDLDGSQWDGIR